jgi:hypothetical protein
MRFLSVKTAAVYVLMLGTAAAQVGGVAGGIGAGPSFGWTGSRSTIGSVGIPMGVT